MAENAEAPAAEAKGETKPTENSATPPKEMRAIMLTGFGGVRMVKVQSRPEQKPEEGEILIRTKACGLNFTDLMVRQGAIDSPPKTPFTMGFECAGEVEALGENVDKFEIGDRVLAVTDYGAWSEAVCVSTQYIYKLPTGMTFHDAAAIFMNYVTAYILLFDIGNLKKGHSVLVHSAGGGVGFAVNQLCQTVGDVTLFGTASKGKHDSLKPHLEHIFDHSSDYCQDIRKVSPEGVDIVLDCLCGEDTNKGIAILKPLGKYVLYGSANVVTGETKSFFSFAKSWWQVDKISPIKLYDDNKTIAGFHLRQLMFKQGRQDYIRSVVETLFQLYNEGKIKPQIDSTWSFEDVGDAMQKLHDRKNIGKVILDPSMEPKPKPAKDKKVATQESTQSGGENSSGDNKAEEKEQDKEQKK